MRLCRNHFTYILLYCQNLSYFEYDLTMKEIVLLFMTVIFQQIDIDQLSLCNKIMTIDIPT